MEGQEQDKKIILLVGKTGKGKSRIVEVLSGKEGLSSTRRTLSFTDKIAFHQSQSEPVYCLVDTPGFGDSQGRDGIFIRELFGNLKQMTCGLVLVAYVKSAVDRLDQPEKQNIQLLNDMFEDKLFANFVVVLTNADKEDDLKTLKETVDDHVLALGEKVPVIPFFGKGEKVEASCRSLLALFAKFEREPRLMTDTLRRVKTEEEKMQQLAKKIEATEDTIEKLQLELELEKEKAAELALLRDAEDEAIRHHVDKQDESFRGFSYLGKALDQAVNLVGKGGGHLLSWLWG